MITVSTNVAPVIRIKTFKCDMCDETLDPRNVSGLCYHCFIMAARTAKRCACGVPLKARNVSGLCRDCRTVEQRLKPHQRQEFRYRVKQGGDAFEISADLMRRDIDESIAQIRTLPSLGSILIEIVAKQLLLRVDDIASAKRFRPLVHARAVVAMVLIENGYSFQRVGKVLGGRDHSSVIHLTDQFETYCERDPRLVRVIEIAREWVKAKRAQWKVAA